jgi:hypothetical protein
MLIIKAIALAQEETVGDGDKGSDHRADAQRNGESQAAGTQPWVIT